MAIVRRRDAFDRDPTAFAREWTAADAGLRDKVISARARLGDVTVPNAVLELMARLCARLGTDGLRGELTLMRSARALASLEGRATVTDRDVRRLAPAALTHRLRRDPLDDAGSAARVERAVSEVLGA